MSLFQILLAVCFLINLFGTAAGSFSTTGTWAPDGLSTTEVTTGTQGTTGVSTQGFPTPPMNATQGAPPASITGMVYVDASLGDSEQTYTHPGGQVTVFEELQFQCVVEDTVSNWLYDINWYINNVKVGTYQNLSEEDLPSAVLREQDWGDNITLGFWIKCGVTARLNTSYQQLAYRISETFYAGLEANQTGTVYLPMGGTRQIGFRSTVPIACWKTGGVRQRCYVQFEARGRLHHGGWRGICPPNDIISELPSEFAKFCGPVIDSANWDQEVSMTIRGLSSQSSYAYSYVDIVGLQHLPVAGSYRDVWGGLNVRTINVYTYRPYSYSYGGNQCSARNDPHMRTFDGRNYENHVEGIFIMYRHKKLPYSVHLIQKRCSTYGVKPVCNFGVAIQSGPDIFIATRGSGRNYYRSPIRVRTNGCFTSGIKVTKDSGYSVVLPTGTKIEIKSGLNSVIIHPSEADRNNAEGLCGNYDGNKCNDFVHRDGGFTSACPFQTTLSVYRYQPTNFILSWSVQPEENLYKGNTTYNGEELGSVIQSETTNTSQLFCTCKPGLGRQGFQWTGLPTPDVFCSTSAPRVTCLHSTQDASNSYACPTKREVNVLYQNLEEDPLPELEFDPDTTPADPSFQGGWTEAAATTRCTQLLQNHPVYSVCSSISLTDVQSSINMCILDIQLSGETEWENFALESYKEHCEDRVLTDNDLWKEPSPGQASLLVSVITKVCPQDCNDRGTCTDGVCVCNSGWEGPDCSVETGKAPGNLTIPKSGLCDVTTKPCKATRVFGELFLESAYLKCRMTELQIDSIGDYATGHVVITDAIFVNSYEVICLLPEALLPSITNAIQPWVTGFSIAVTNDGVLFGDEAIIIPADVNCLNCTTSPGQASCTLMSNYCYIGSRCYGQAATDPSSACNECDPDKSRLSWTKKVGQTCGAGGILANVLIMFVVTLTSTMVVSFTAQ